MPITTGASWVQIQASETVADGAMSTGASSPVSITHTHLLEFRLNVSSAPAAAGSVHLYRRRSDGTNDAPQPTTGYKQEYVGTFNLNNAADDYFCGPISNFDPNDTFYWFNDTGSSVTATLYGRTKEYS